MNNFVLGCAQLGSNYGVYNRTGQPNYKTASNLVQRCLDFGVCEFDTANSYGNSEAMLGDIFEYLGVRPRILTKVEFATGYWDVIEGQIMKTREYLKMPVYGVFIHDHQDVRWYHQLFEQRWKEDYGIKKFGMSLYNPEDAMKVLDQYHVDMVQVPFSLLDQRALDIGLFDKAKELGKEVYVRSIFLKGRLLNFDDSIFAESRGDRCIELMEENHSLLEICLNFVRTRAPEAKIIFGAETVKQVQEFIDVKRQPATIIAGLEEFKCEDLNIIDPRMWK